MPIPTNPAEIKQTSIPKIQSEDWTTNQLQINLIKAFQQLQDQVTKAVNNLQKQIDSI